MTFISEIYHIITSTFKKSTFNYGILHLELLMCSCKFDLVIKPMFTLMHEVFLVGELTFTLLFSFKKIFFYKDLKRFLRRLFADGKFLDEKFAS